MLELSDFHKVTLEDGARIRKHYKKYTPKHSDYLHGIMYTWRDYMAYSIAWRGEHLLILGEHEGKHYIRPPMGPYSRDIFEEVIDLARREGWDPLVSMIGGETREWMEKEFPDLAFETHRDYFDYVYLASDLADLPGKPYLKVRYYLNKFVKNNDHIVETLGHDNVQETKEFLVKWCMQKGCQDDPFLMHERQATMHALDDLEELGLGGTVLRVNKEIQAFSIYEELSLDTVVIHYEKANFDIVGLYQAINWETAKALRDRYTYIDRESDMGVEGLRRAKLKYRPQKMLEIHHAR